MTTSERTTPAGSDSLGADQATALAEALALEPVLAQGTALVVVASRSCFRVRCTIDAVADKAATRLNTSVAFR